MARFKTGELAETLKFFKIRHFVQLLNYEARSVAANSKIKSKKFTYYAYWKLH